MFPTMAELLDSLQLLIRALLSRGQHGITTECVKYKENISDQNISISPRIPTFRQNLSENSDYKTK